MKTFREYLEERESLDEGLLASAAPLMLAAMSPGQYQSSSMEQFKKLEAEIESMFQRSAQAQDMAKKVEAAVKTMDTPGSKQFLNDPETRLFLLYNPQYSPFGPPKGSSERDGWEYDQRINADKHWKAAEFRDMLRKSLKDDKEMLQKKLDAKKAAEKSGAATGASEKPVETDFFGKPKKSLRELMAGAIKEKP